MLCIMCRKTFPHGLACTNCGFNYSNIATFTSLFKLDITTTNDTIANQRQSLAYNELLDKIRLEREGTAVRQEMRAQQPVSKITGRRPSASGYARSHLASIANQAQSLEYDVLLDKIHLEREGAVRKQRIQLLRQAGSKIIARSLPTPGYTRKSRPVVFELLGYGDRGNDTSNYAEALSDLNDAIKIDPNNGYLYFLRAEINYLFGQTSLVRRDLVHAISKTPCLVDYYCVVETLDQLSSDDITIIKRAFRSIKAFHKT